MQEGSVGPDSVEDFAFLQIFRPRHLHGSPDEPFRDNPSQWVLVGRLWSALHHPPFASREHRQGKEQKTKSHDSLDQRATGQHLNGADFWGDIFQGVAPHQPVETVVGQDRNE